MDRSEINRTLAKAIAYKQCGKHTEAKAWAARLVDMLECADILDRNVQQALGEATQRGKFIR